MLNLLATVTSPPRIVADREILVGICVRRTSTCRSGGSGRTKVTIARSPHSSNAAVRWSSKLTLQRIDMPNIAFSFSTTKSFGPCSSAFSLQPIEEQNITISFPRTRDLGSCSPASSLQQIEKHVIADPLRRSRNSRSIALAFSLQQIEKQNIANPFPRTRTRNPGTLPSEFTLQRIEKQNIAIFVPNTTSASRSLACSLQHTSTRNIDIAVERTRNVNAGSNCYGRSVGRSGIIERRRSKRIGLPSLHRPGVLRSSVFASIHQAKEEFGSAVYSAWRETSTVAAFSSNLPGGEWESEKMRSNIGAVFFDLDDTLVLTHEADKNAQMAVMDMLKVRAPELDLVAVLSKFIDQFSTVAWDPEHKVDVTEWRARLWNNAMKPQGLDDMDLGRELQSCFDRERLLGFRWTTGVEKLVGALHGQGVKVGIITNGHPKVQRAKLGACNAKDMFDTILVGGEEPNPKPHRDIFLKACNLAGCKPEESVMVGDTLKTDIQGAISAGFLSAVWVNVHKKQPPHDDVKPHFEISTFSELQQVLQQLGVSFDPSD